MMALSKYIFENGQKYAPLDSCSDTSEIQDATLNKSTIRKNRLWPWIVSTFLFGFTTLALFIQSLRNHSRICSTHMWETELPVSTKQSKVKFFSSLTFDESGNFFNEHITNEDIWVDKPSPELDAKWDFSDIWNLLLEGEEADLVRDKTLMYDGYWITGLDVFHQLHCLDMLRKAIYPDYYNHSALSYDHVVHQEHCVDYLRQVIMCNADTTPVPQKWVPRANRTGPNFATEHTCGSFDDALNWARQRNAKARKGQHGREIAKDPAVVVTEEQYYGVKSEIGHLH